MSGWDFCSHLVGSKAGIYLENTRKWKKRQLACVSRGTAWIGKPATDEIHVRMTSPVSLFSDRGKHLCLRVLAEECKQRNRNLQLTESTREVTEGWSFHF